MLPERMTFDKLKRRLTLNFAAIFALVLLVVVLVSTGMNAYLVLNNEEKMLVTDVRDEWREYVNSRELPVNPDAVDVGERMALMYGTDGELVLDQLTGSPFAQQVTVLRGKWPQADGETRLLHFTARDGSKRFYLAALGTQAGYGTLYTFKDLSDYYNAVVNSLYFTVLLCAVCLAVAMAGGYYMASRVIRPMEQLFKREREFTADASHELRTPLTVFTVGVDALQSDAESRYSDFAAGIIDDLKRETAYMSRLLETLLNIARSDAGAISYNMQRENLSAAAERICKNMQPLAQRKGLALAFACPPAPVFVKCDLAKIEQLLIILIDNAIKYSESGTVTLEVGGTLHSAVLKVTDEGIGISREDAEKVFERFFRVDKARSRQSKSGGFGLGLSIAKKIVTVHNGDISAAPREPKGACFTVKLPLSR